jgi:hypothetical protein
MRYSSSVRKQIARWHIDGSAVWSGIFVALVAFGAQLVAYVWIQHWQQGFNAVTTLMLLTSVVIGLLAAALEVSRQRTKR